MVAAVAVRADQIEADQKVRGGAKVPSDGLLGGPAPPPDAVRSLREAYEMTQPQFGYLLDVGGAQVREWEKARQPMPFEKFELACLKLGEDPEEWITGVPAGGPRAKDKDEAIRVRDMAISATQRVRARAVMHRRPT